MCFSDRTIQTLQADLMSGLLARGSNWAPAFAFPSISGCGSTSGGIAAGVPAAVKKRRFPAIARGFLKGSYGRTGITHDKPAYPIFDRLPRKSSLDKHDG